MTFGETLRKLREDRGLSQAELAGKVGLSQGAIAHYERGSRALDVETVLALTQALGVSVEELAGSRPIQKKMSEVRPHRNRRGVKIQDLFDKLAAADQRAILKQVRSLLAQDGK